MVRIVLQSATVKTQEKKSYRLVQRSVPFCFIMLNQHNQVLGIDFRTFPQGNSYILTQLICRKYY